MVRTEAEYSDMVVETVYHSLTRKSETAIVRQDAERLGLRLRKRRG